MACCDPCWSAYPTLSLERWRDLLCCLDPYPFWQWRPANESKGACDALVLQHQWGRKYLGREEIRKAISRAEQIIATKLGYPVLPTELSEYIHLPNNIRLYDHSCERVILRTERTHLISLGKPTRTLLGTAPVVYSDQFSGLRDTFNATLAGVVSATAVTADEIEVYFAQADRFNLALPLAHWRIDPAHVTVTGTGPYTINVEGRSWLMAVPKLYERRSAFQAPISSQPGSYGLNPDHNGNYVTEIAIYRKQVAPCKEGRAIYEPTECTCGAVEDCPTCDTCEDIQLCIVDGLAGMFRPVFKPNACRCRRVIGLCVDYTAGDCTYDWSRIVVALAAAEMSGCCICDCSFPCLQEWTDDLAVLNAKNENGKTATVEQLNNPFGTKGGHVYAYGVIADRLAADPQSSYW